MKVNTTSVIYPVFIAFSTLCFAGSLLYFSNIPNFQFWGTFAPYILIFPFVIFLGIVIAIWRQRTIYNVVSRQHRLLFENMINAFVLGKVITNEKGEPLDFKIVLLNVKFAEILGKKINDAIGKNFSEVVPQAARELTLKYCQVGLTGIPYNPEYYSTTFDRYLKANAYSPEKGYVAIILEDITNLQISLNKFKESEEKFRSAFENSNIGVCLVDLNGNFMKVNEQLCEIYGYSKQELEALNVNDITIPEDRITNVYKNSEMSKSPDKRSNFERRYFHKNGNLIYCNVSSSLIKDKENNPLYVISHVRDITIQKKQADQIKSERKQFLTLLNDIPECIYVSDFETHEILFANTAKFEVFGDNLLGKHCYNAFYGYDSPCEFCKRSEVTIAANETLRWEHFNPTVQKHFYIIDKLIQWYDNKRAKFQIAFDITELKNAEKQIRKLSVAVEQNPTTIVITDNQGNIEYANPRFTELTGYTTDEAIGKNPRVLKSGKTDEKVFKDLWKTIRSGKTWHGEFINRKKNGDEFIENAVIAPILDENGAIINYIAIKEDITARKQQEEIIKQNNTQLKELNATKDMFFSIIAHDLKNPFNNILGFSELLTHNVHKYNQDKTLQFAQSINRAARNAYKLLENLLEWARMQTGSIEFKPELIVLENLILEIIGVISANSTAKNILVSYEISDCIQMFADKNMINTVLRNLVTNAIKYTHKNGAVKIVTTCNVSEVHIAVIDNGIGINSEKIKKLFKINEKTTTPGTEDERGTGLGLILCKEFVEKHNGKIWVESEVGKGSRFIFSLPKNLNYQ